MSLPNPSIQSQMMPSTNYLEINQGVGRTSAAPTFCTAAARSWSTIAACACRLTCRHSATKSLRSSWPCSNPSLCNLNACRPCASMSSWCVDVALMKALDAVQSALRAAVADQSTSSTDTSAKLLVLPSSWMTPLSLRDFTRDDDKGRFRQMVLDALLSASEVSSAETAAQRLNRLRRRCCCTDIEHRYPQCENREPRPNS